MCITLDIEDDVPAALSGDGAPMARKPQAVAGFRPFQSIQAELISNEQIDQLRDRDGL